MTNDNTDDELRARLRDRLGLKSEDAEADADAGAGSDDTSTDMDEKMDDDGDDEDMEEKASTLEEAVAAIAENTDEDVSAEDVMDMLEPIMGEGDYGDDDEDDDMEQDAEGELKADDVKEIVGATLDAKLDEMGLVTEDQLDEKLSERDSLEERIDEKMDDVVTEGRLDDVVSAIGDEVEATMQKADVGSTPTPGSGGGSELSTDDILWGGGD